jgi:hypothetical protein
MTSFIAAQSTTPLARAVPIRETWPMAISGSRFTVERQKLCLWLEAEKRKLHLLPAELKKQKDVELEREFRTRLDRLYGDVQSRPAGRVSRTSKLN